MTPPSVLIVGGGPCGLLAAVLLARAGVPALVLEKNPGLSTHPKAMGVSRRTAEIYRQLGLLDRMREGSLDTEGRDLAIWSKTLVGEELGRTPIAAHHSPLTPCASAHCPQTWTEHVLYEALIAEPLAAVRFSTEVVRLDPGGDRVTVVAASGETFEAPWVIAADGAGSPTRRQLGVETDGPGDLGHFVNVMFRAPFGRHLEQRRAVLYQSLTTEGFEAFVAVNGDDLWLMHHFLDEGETAADYSAERFAAIIRTMSGLEEPVDVLGMSPWVMSPKLARRFRVGRIFLTGDAAARLSPAGGLGLNTGLQSVHNLAWKLAAVVRGEARDALLDTYDSERREAAGRTLEHTNRNAFEIRDIVTAALSGDWTTARDRIQHSRRGEAGLGQDLGVAYASGAFLADGTEAPAVSDPINAYLPVARPGHRAPHVEIVRHGSAASLLDLFGSHPCVLAGREGTAWPGALCNGRDFFAEAFENAYGIELSGAVVVRPDGYVGARFATQPSDPAAALHHALATIFAR